MSSPGPQETSAKALFKYTAYLIAVFPGIYLAVRFTDSLSTFDKIATVILPIIVGWAFFYLTDQSTKRVLDDSFSIFKSHFDKSLSTITNSRGVVYATKKSVPGQATYWNHLAVEAQNILCIVGTTNKSWFDKSEEQCRRLSQEFARIKSNGGQVQIIALASEASEIIMRNFAKKYCYSKSGNFLNTFVFRVVERLNYAVVLNDQRIVIMPIPHDSNFREETMVIEIARRDSESVYENYRADVERLVTKSKTIEV